MPLYKQNGQEFTLSRSKIELFLQCKHCFFLDRKKGISRPKGFPFNLNMAVDTLLKQEFDSYRRQGVQHPLTAEYNLDCIPYNHDDLDLWRDNFKGISYHHYPTNFTIKGAIDDIWRDSSGTLYIVDYKASSSKYSFNIHADFRASYRRQMEIYQWLFKMNGFNISNKGYFVYCNGKVDDGHFNNCLKFDTEIVRYEGNYDWVEPTLQEIYEVLNSDNPPPLNDECPYCVYRNQKVEDNSPQASLF